MNLNPCTLVGGTKLMKVQTSENRFRRGVVKMTSITRVCRFTRQILRIVTTFFTSVYEYLYSSKVKSHIIITTPIGHG